MVNVIPANVILKVVTQCAQYKRGGLNMEFDLGLVVMCVYENAYSHVCV